MDSNVHLSEPAKFHIYGFQPAFKMFRGPVIVKANPEGHPLTSSLSGTVANFKAFAATALYNYCQANSIDMF